MREKRVNHRTCCNLISKHAGWVQDAACSSGLVLHTQNNKPGGLRYTMEALARTAHKTAQIEAIQGSMSGCGDFRIDRMAAKHGHEKERNLTSKGMAIAFARSVMGACSG